MTKKLHSYCFTTQLPLYLVKKKEKFYQKFLYSNRKNPINANWIM